MKRFKITAIITTENKYDADSVLMQIDRDLNRGDGLYMQLSNGDKHCEIVEITEAKKPRANRTLTK